MASGTSSICPVGFNIQGSNVFFNYSVCQGVPQSSNFIQIPLAQYPIPHSSPSHPTAQLVGQFYHQNMPAQSQAAPLSSLLPTYFPPPPVFPLGNPLFQASLYRHPTTHQFSASAPQTASVPATFSSSSVPPLAPHAQNPPFGHPAAPPAIPSQNRRSAFSPFNPHSAQQSVSSSSYASSSSTLSPPSLIQQRDSAPPPPTNEPVNPSAGGYKKAKKKRGSQNKAAASSNSEATSFCETHFARFYPKGTEIRFGERNFDLYGTVEDETLNGEIIKVRMKNTETIAEIAPSQLKPTLKIGDRVLLLRKQTKGLHLLCVVRSIRHGSYICRPVAFESGEEQSFSIDFKTKGNCIKNTIRITTDAQLDGLEELPLLINGKSCKSYQL